MLNPGVPWVDRLAAGGSSLRTAGYFRLGCALCEIDLDLVFLIEFVLHGES